MVTSIPFLSDTGRFSLPVVFSRRRAVISTSPEGPTLEVGGSGGVMVAASASQVLTLVNSGALQVTYSLNIPVESLAESAEWREQPAKDGSSEVVTSVSIGGFTICNTRGILPAHGNRPLQVEFAPKVAGEHGPSGSQACSGLLSARSIYITAA
jgi:hypothetical protein